uniref:Amino acid transporter n=1 Tax=Toxocara canis TaxID=6265 RepID=A0A183VCY0_TOXCA
LGKMKERGKTLIECLSVVDNITMKLIMLNGEALYEAVTAIFVAQLTGWELSALRLIIISLIATLCSIGAAAVPSSGVVTVVIVLNALGLGTQHVAMIFAIDWFIDRVRTSVNVIGDAFAAGVVYHYCRKVLQNLGTVQGSTEAIPERTDAIREETAIASVSSEEQTAMNVEEPAADKTVSGSVDEHSYRPEGNDILTPSSESRQNLKP